MDIATIDRFASAVDTLKLKYGRLLSNVFSDNYKLKDDMQKKECFVFSTEESLFLLIPYHNAFHDLLYCSANQETLEKDIKSFLQSYHMALRIRVSIVGKEAFANEMYNVFEKCGFELIKKLMRSDISGRNTSQKINDARKSLTFGKKKKEVEEGQFAEVEDAREILDLLMTEFDVCADSIPELEDIVDNILKRHVHIIKRDNKVVCLHYFTVNNGICFRLYDLSHKEYRKEFLYYRINRFTIRYFKTLGKSIKRYYGWRDAKNKRLIKYARLCNESMDGVTIYNAIWHPENKMASCKVE